MPSPSNPTDSSRSNQIAILLLAIAVAWCLYWFVHAWHYWEDDAYIHLEFARSLATGQGFAFNGRVVAGDTAPLWVFLLVAVHAAAHALIPNWLIAGKVLAALATVFSLTAAYAFTRRLAAALVPSAPAWLPAALILLIVANPYFCYWAFSGMEPLAAAGLAFCAVLLATPATPSIPTLLTACLLAGLAPLLRPEMIFLTALLTLPLFAQGRRLPATTTSPAKLVSFAASILLLVTPLAAWSLYSLHAFGHLIPNTNAAKRAAPHDSVVLHLLSIYALGLPLVLCGLLAGIVYLVLRPSTVRCSLRRAFASLFAQTANAPAPPSTSRNLPLAGWLFLLWPSIVTVFYTADHTYVQTRYIMATAPGLTIVIFLLVLSASQLAGRAAYAAALIAALAVSVVTVRPFIRNKAINCLATRDFAHSIRDRIPPNAPVADYAIGQIAFDSEHPIVDTGGITQPGAIPYLNGPQEAALRWAQSQGAQYYVADKQHLPGSVVVFTTNQMFVGWTIHTALYATSAPMSLWKIAP
jgi:hypothetical protein